MSYAEVDICNLAISRTGSDKTIIALSENSKEARLCARFYAHCRDEVLERAPWPFAIRTAAMAQLPDSDMLPGWGYGYALPTDALQVIEVIPAGMVTDAVGYYTNCACDAPWMPCRECKTPFVKAAASDGLSTVVLSNLDDAYAVYTARVTAVGMFSAMFRSTLAWRLCMELVMPLTQDDRKLQLAVSAYNAQFVDTASRQFEQQQNGPSGDAPAIRARA